MKNKNKKYIFLVYRKCTYFFVFIYVFSIIFIYSTVTFHWVYSQKLKIKQIQGGKRLAGGVTYRLYKYFFGNNVYFIHLYTCTIWSYTSLLTYKAHYETFSFKGDILFSYSRFIILGLMHQCPHTVRSCSSSFFNLRLKLLVLIQRRKQTRDQYVLGRVAALGLFAELWEERGNGLWLDLERNTS